MTTVAHVTEILEAFAPGDLAEPWDNVGLLLGDPERSVSRLMTCLSITPDAAAEAVDQQADLIVTHHPLPFQPLSRLTTDTTAGRILWDLAAARIAIFSPHTALDSAAAGINHQLCAGLALSAVAPLVASPEDPAIGSGRFGNVSPSTTLDELAARVKQFLCIDSLRVVGPPDAPVTRVAVACGSGGGFLESAARAGCDCLVTGETNFHTCLEAEATGVGLILAGHYASERFAVERLADYLAGQLSGVHVWPSRREHDPLRPA